VTRTVVTRGTVVIDVDACKGCDLCVDACPPGVLIMTDHLRNARGYRYPELRPGCTACRACAQICPDFVFQVWKFDEPVAIAVEPRPDGGSGPTGEPA
jgi:2-oxoglutarate ferredoxin oxidoreductase subunit delta